MNVLKLTLALMLLLASLSLSAKDFTFTAIPDQDSTQLEARFSKVSAYLERRAASRTA